MKKISDYDAASDEFFSKRRDRRKPKGRRSVRELYASDAASGHTFADASLQALYERGFLTEMIGQLKSGKEATVYLAEGPQGLLAAKVYSDVTVRSFRNDAVYREGRFVADRRIKKAIDQRSLNGIQAQQAMWVYHEYLQLWELYRAGVSVPAPRVGPDSSDLVAAGRTVLMDFIGTREAAAPRLSEARLSPEEAESAWAQSVEIVTQLLALGKVHGDYSTYNLLWWEGRVIVIDFPQMVSVAENPQAGTLLTRDATSLCTSFRRHGIKRDPDETLWAVRQQVKARQGR